MTERLRQFLSPRAARPDASVFLRVSTPSEYRRPPLAACGKMDAFVNQVGAQSGKKLTIAQADQLIAGAHEIQAELGCP